MKRATRPLPTLLVDIGNTRIKWALLKAGRLGRQQATGHDAKTGGQIARHILDASFASRRPVQVSRVVVVSVASSSFNTQFSREIRLALRVRPELFSSRRRVAGVTTLYAEPWRLGADRLAAAIGGWHASGHRPVCVIGVGTAMTLDLVDGEGRHRGGAIVPSPSLMIRSLLSQTHGIRRRARGGSGGSNLFARSTRAAVAQGARFAAAAVAERAVEEARMLLGTTPAVLLTGGAAPDVQKLMRVRHRYVPDLVLRGLAVFASAQENDS